MCLSKLRAKLHWCTSLLNDNNDKIKIDDNNNNNDIYDASDLLGTRQR